MVVPVTQATEAVAASYVIGHVLDTEGHITYYLSYDC